MDDTPKPIPGSLYGEFTPITVSSGSQPIKEGAGEPLTARDLRTLELAANDYQIRGWAYTAGVIRRAVRLLSPEAPPHV